MKMHSKKASSEYLETVGSIIGQGIDEIDVRVTSREVPQKQGLECDCCGSEIVYNAKFHPRYVIVNSFAPADDDGSFGTWVGDLRFHEPCYSDIEQPFGAAERKSPNDKPGGVESLSRIALSELVIVENR